jgi:hypothetical protein
MSEMPSMEELRELDEAGYRAVGSLLAGDSFVYRDERHVVRRIQRMPPLHEPMPDGRIRLVERVAVVTETPVGDPKEITRSDGSTVTRQSTASFVFHPMLLFLSQITDEHFEAERGQSWVDQANAGSMW